MMALTFLYLSHEGYDGKSGMSVQDIVDNYYGNRGGTRLEAAICGPMASHVERTLKTAIASWRG